MEARDALEEEEMLWKMAKDELLRLQVLGGAEPPAAEGIALRGGFCGVVAPTFARLGVPEDLQRVEISSVGHPYWRAVNGLNLEARCKHRSCPSFLAGHTIVLPVGIVDRWDLHSGRFEHRCPSCDTEIDPDAITTIAVVRCHWEYKGRIVHPSTSSGLPREGHGTAWDDAYYRFPDGPNEEVEWHYLYLCTKSL